MSRRLLLLLLLLFALQFEIVLSRVCSTANPCQMATIQCTDPSISPNCSYIFQSTRSFPTQQAALTACKSRFGASSTLVTPGDAATNAQVFGLCGSHRFLDMKRRPGNLCYQWETLDGSQVISYFNWDQGEPTRPSGGCPQAEDCAGMKLGRNGLWHDGTCVPRGSDSSWVAQCVVCTVEPTPAPAPAPTPSASTPLQRTLPTVVPIMVSTTTTVQFSETSDTTAGQSSETSDATGGQFPETFGTDGLEMTPPIDLVSIGIGIAAGVVFALAMVALAAFVCRKRNSATLDAAKPADDRRAVNANANTYDVVPDAGSAQYGHLRLAPNNVQEEYARGALET
jgi:hypothetical protein